MVDFVRVSNISVSNYSAWQLMKASSIAAPFVLEIEMMQPMYCLIKRQVEIKILPMCVSENIAVVPYSPLGGGLLTGEYNVCVTGSPNIRPHISVSL